MRMVDLIAKKKQGGALTPQEIRFLIDGYVGGEIPDYQMSAMLMAICFRGMNPGETTELTLAMAESGDQMDLSAIDGIKVDKHSTGGVGDKTTLVVAPAAAACGVRVAKMSGRGLGHTGGTIDKLEAIPGFRTALTTEEFFRAVNETGLAVVGQTGNLAPADKKLYALRDVTATVDSIPLIASSIMSKKLAAGSNAILLDVKTGSGAFMKTEKDAVRLAQAMVEIGEAAGRRTVAVITEMGVPLGTAVGNALETAEAIRVLQGGGPEDLRQICLLLTSEMAALAGLAEGEAARRLAEEAITSGRALASFRAMVQAQGGDGRVADDPGLLPQALFTRCVKAETSGWVSAMDTGGIGTASMLLGAGRATKEDSLDPAAGLVLKKKRGDYVEAGETLAVLHAGDPALFAASEERLLASYQFAAEQPEPVRLVRARVDRAGVTRGEKG